MLNRLKQMKLHYEQLAEKIASPEVMADMNAWRELVKEHSTLEPIITAYDEYLETERGIADCRAMLDSEETEQEMRTLAEEELAELSHKAAQQQEDLKILLLPKDKNDERNVIMEIRAGTGGIISNTSSSILPKRKWAGLRKPHSASTAAVHIPE